MTTTVSEREDYRKSRKLATIEHLGRTFHVVRRKFNGKPWRGYLALVYEGVPMTMDFAIVTDPSDVEMTRVYWAETLQRLFPDTDAGRRSMDEGITHCTEKYRRG